MGARILVIEDHPANLQLMVYLLGAFGHEVTTATNGEDGLGLAMSGAFELVLCDIQLPGLDGYSVVASIKHAERPVAAPVVAVTAYAMAGDRQRLLAAGFDGYISKPIVPETFVGEVERFLPPDRVGRARAAGARGKRRAAAKRPSKPPLVLAVDDSLVNLGVLRGALEPQGFDVAMATNVEGALQLARERRPTLILSDIHMPAGDGFELIRRVRADDVLRDVPVAFTSATVWGPEDRDRAFAAGAVDFILRPMGPAELADRVLATIRKFGHGHHRPR